MHCGDRSLRGLHSLKMYSLENSLTDVFVPLLMLRYCELSMVLNIRKTQVICENAVQKYRSFSLDVFHIFSEIKKNRVKGRCPVN